MRHLGWRVGNTGQSSLAIVQKTLVIQNVEVLQNASGYKLESVCDLWFWSSVESPEVAPLLSIDRRDSVEDLAAQLHSSGVVWSNQLALYYALLLVWYQQIIKRFLEAFFINSLA